MRRFLARSMTFDRITLTEASMRVSTLLESRRQSLCTISTIEAKDIGEFDKEDVVDATPAETLVHRRGLSARDIVAPAWMTSIASAYHGLRQRRQNYSSPLESDAVTIPRHLTQANEIVDEDASLVQPLSRHKASNPTAAEFLVSENQQLQSKSAFNEKLNQSSNDQRLRSVRKSLSIDISSIPQGQLDEYRAVMDFTHPADGELELRVGQAVKMLYEFTDGWVRPCYLELLCIRLTVLSVCASVLIILREALFPDIVSVRNHQGFDQKQDYNRTVQNQMSHFRHLHTSHEKNDMTILRPATSVPTVMRKSHQKRKLSQILRSVRTHMSDSHTSWTTIQQAAYFLAT